jgi:hypothetical protein
MTTTTRRPTRQAVNSDWLVAAACRTTDPEAFFSDQKADLKAARKVCVGCPVLKSCLSRQMRAEETLYRWGVAGGLSREQRRALYGELVLGGRPNLGMARWLAVPQGRYRLMAAWKASGSRLAGTVELLRAEGLLVDEVTVRVALWWAGERVPRLTSVPSGDGPARAARLAAEDGAVILRLRGLGVSSDDVAAFLGARRETTVNAIRLLEAESDTAALDKASEAVDAA